MIPAPSLPVTEEPSNINVTGLATIIDLNANITRYRSRAIATNNINVKIVTKEHDANVVIIGTISLDSCAPQQDDIDIVFRCSDTDISTCDGGTLDGDIRTLACPNTNTRARRSITFNCAARNIDGRVVVYINADGGAGYRTAGLGNICIVLPPWCTP